MSPLSGKAIDKHRLSPKVVAYSILSFDRNYYRFKGYNLALKPMN